MKGTLKAACLLALACGMLAGCTKNGMTGKAVTFTATTASDETRTAYSGEGTTSSGVLVKERIDWVDGDKITIFSPEALIAYSTTQHAADYVVDSHTTEGTRSRAIISPLVQTSTGMANGLWWDESSSTNTFYARYPAKADAISATGMKAEIPDHQKYYADGTADMDYAFMFAKATAVPGAAEVKLEFKPEFTAFQFQIDGGGNEAIKVTSITLSSTTSTLAGSFMVNCSDDSVTLGSDATSTLTIDFPTAEGITVVTDPTKPVIINFFALPVETISNLTLTIKGSKIGTRKLKLTDASGTMLSFPGKKKYIIKNLNLPELLNATGEDINWDVEAKGESIYWD